MKKYYVLAVCLFISISVFGQSSYPRVPYSNLNDVISDGANILAIGSCDKGMLSSDFGQTWQYFDFDESAYRLERVPGEDATKAYVLTNTEVLYLDGMEGSLTSTGITSSSLLSGQFVDFAIRGNEMIISGKIGVFRVSLNDNSSIQIGELNYPSDDRIESSILTENYVYTCTRKGLLFRSSLNDSSTKLVNTLDIGNVKNLAMSSDEVGYLGVSGSNQPYKTTDGGESWTILGSFSETATVYSPNEDVVLSVNTNRILVSTDGGQTAEYVPYNSPDLGLMSRVRFLDDGTMFMVGSSSLILRSDDYGLSYENLIPYSRTGFYNIDIHDDGSGIATSDVTTVVTTADNGDSWTKIDYQPLEGQNNIESAIALGNNEFLLTHNKGITKLTETSSLLISNEELILIRKSKVGDYLLGIRNQGGSFLIRKSVDEGVTWETKSVVDDFSYQINQNQSGNWYLSNRMEGTIFMGSPDAEIWESKSINLAGIVYNVTHFSDDLGLYSVGNTLYKTTDGGESFSSISTAYAQNNIHMITEDHYILTTAQNSLTTVRETKDGGASWSTLKIFCSQTFSFDFMGDRYWIGQRGGHINYLTIDLSTSSEDLSRDKAINRPVISIHTNKAELRFKYPTSGKLYVYSQSGEMVLQSKLINQSRYTVDLDELSSGVYFYQLLIDETQYSGKVPVIR